MSGRWAGMWQFITRPADSKAEWPVKISGRAKSLGEIEHQLTHRRYEFVVKWAEAGKCGAEFSAKEVYAWSTLTGLEQYPLPRPHLRIAEMLQAIK